MLLTELDGYLSGLLVYPETIPTDEWMAVIWGVETGEILPFKDPLDVQWFAKAVIARRDEIARDLLRGKRHPILDVDERDGEVLWEYWIDGFAAAISLRADAWTVLTDDSDRVEPWSRMMVLIAVAREESDLDGMEINTFQSDAVAELTDTVQRRYAARASGGGVNAPAVPATMATKIDRNHPCDCGSPILPTHLPFVYALHKLPARGRIP